VANSNFPQVCFQGAMALYGANDNRAGSMNGIKLSRHGFNANDDARMIGPTMQRLNKSHKRIRLGRNTMSSI